MTVRLLFITRFIRLFAYGALSVVLVIYLTQLGLSDTQTGMLLTFILVGDALLSLWLTTQADRFGRRRTLMVGSLLMAGAGLVFALTDNLLALVIAGTIGVISPSGHEVGPFLSIEQATLSHVVSDRERTQTFAWYALTGAIATALGSLCSGLLPQVGHSAVMPVQKARHVIWMYAALGLVLAFLFGRLSLRRRSVDRLNRPREPISGDRTLSRRCPSTSSTVRVGLVRRRICRPELGGVLVSLAIRDGTGGSREHLFRCESLCRHLGATGLEIGNAHPACQDDGFHTPAFKHPSYLRTAHAESHIRDRSSAREVQHQPNGRARPAIVHDGDCTTGRTGGRSGDHRCREDHRCCDGPGLYGVYYLAFRR